MQARSFGAKKAVLLSFFIVIIIGLALFFKFFYKKSVATHKTFEVSKKNFFKTDTITDIVKYIKEGDLVVFDVDAVLLAYAAKGNLGNSIDAYNKRYILEAIPQYLAKNLFEKYFDIILERAYKAGVSQDKKLFIQKAFKSYIFNHVVGYTYQIFGGLDFWEKYITSHYVPEPVEKEIITIINNLKRKNIACMAITEKGWKHRAQELLEKVGIALDAQHSFKKQIVNIPKKDEELGFIFRNNILYILLNKKIIKNYVASKGVVLSKFFEKSNYTPKRVVFVDDKKEELMDVLRSMQAKKIPVFGIWYTAMEKRDCNPQKGPQKKYRLYSLSESDIKVLNYYLPKDWKYVDFDIDEAVKYILKELKIL